MKVLLINTYEQGGGAAIAANRLMKSLCDAGVDARMLVARKSSTDTRVTCAGRRWQQMCAFVWERAVIWLHNRLSRRNLFAVSIANTGFDVTRLPEFRQADIIHLHWVNQGMLSLNGIRRILESGKPVVWTMHDMWPCTGICHHAYRCTAFRTACKQCPFLQHPGTDDLAHRVFARKLRTYAKARMHMVAVSSWLASRAGGSALLHGKPLTVIPNTLSPDDFQLLPRDASRRALGLPADAHIILFGAARIDDPIKGFPMLNQAVGLLESRFRLPGERLHLVLFGRIKHPEQVLPQIRIGYTRMGTVTDRQLLSQLYSAADVTVSASHYETFGQTLIEAQACGCLPVAFDSGGQTDIIRHRANGYLASYPQAESLAEGIAWALTEGKTAVSREALRKEAVAKYAGTTVAGKYIELYKQLTEGQDIANQ